MKIRPIAEADGYEPIVALLSDESGDVRVELAQSVRRGLEDANYSDQGFYVAEIDGRIVGAASVSVAEGRIASVRPPVWLEPAGTVVRDALFARLNRLVASRTIDVAYASLPGDDDASENVDDAWGVGPPSELARPTDFLFDGRRWRRSDDEALVENGFAERSDLDVLACDPRNVSVDATPSDRRLTWAPASVLASSRLEELIAATYHASLDCPALNGRRRIEDVLAGYRADCRPDDSTWRIAFVGSEPAGCLFLSDRPETETCELLYLGIVPTQRGRGFGASLVREALRFAAIHGRKALALSVDARNWAAGGIYRSFGFERIERRALFLKFSGAATEAAPTPRRVA